MKYNIGDKVIVVRDDLDNKLGSHMFAPGTLVTVIDHVSDSLGNYYEMLDPKTDAAWFLSDSEVKPVKEDENISHLQLVKAEFRTRKGLKVTVKRSPCRHYYLKVDGQTQRRVSLSEIKRVVADVR